MSVLLFTSGPDAKIILGEGDPARIAKFLHNEGVRTVVVKLGDKGAFASFNGETATVPMTPSDV